MAVIKCKMCGGDLVIEQGNSVAECEYCGTQQTLPKITDEVIQNLFNRANNLRLKCEFDKAEQIYEKILQQNDNEPEAHWGIILCKYGIEYVEDPKTFKRVPTCHRTSYDAVTADSDYLAAIENADVVSRGIYEAEAKAIDEIQKNILDIVKNEKPFDVFICYKETDENGKRTVDSTIANDIYHQLTQEGLKVFYAAITLEDKLGQEYEPYIFAALNSAKAMLVIGTKPEYFTAVWVKNEWSRYLKLMKTDRSKLLIPCYKDMDAYDLPEEFAHLQAQDMSKIGFINDVVRGIKKVIVKDEPKAETVVKQTIVTEGNTNTAPLLKRAFMFLEDADWKSADEYCEKVLDIDPECAEAYLGKLLAELRVRKKEQLKDCKTPFEERNNCQKVMRFGDETVTGFIKDCTNYINERNENERLEKEYLFVVRAMEQAKNEKGRAQVRQYRNVANQFKKLNNFKDASLLSKQCTDIANELEMQLNRLQSQNESFLKEKREKHNVFKNRIAISIRAQSKQHFAVNSDGIVISSGIDEFGRHLLDSWKNSNVIAISAGECHLVGLSSRGNALAAGDNRYNQCSVSCWEHLIDIKAGGWHTVGLRSDGTVVATGYNGAGECDVSEWRDIVSISAGGSHSLGLKSYGTVVATGSNGSGQCDVSEWRDIIAISAGGGHSLGLKSDGTVVASGNNGNGQCDVSEWSDIIAISAGYRHSLGLKSDGTVVATGDNDAGECDVSEWKDIRAAMKSIENQYKGAIALMSAGKYTDAKNIFEKLGDYKDSKEKINECIEFCKIFAPLFEHVTISAGYYHSIGLKSDGTVVATGYNKYGQCDVSAWKDIVSISAGGGHSLGLKSDGTVVATGDNKYGQCDVSEWRDIIAISAGVYHSLGLKSDGTVVATEDNEYGQCNVSKWKDIVSISAGGRHSLGLKSDGTVVATGYNGNGECDVSEWSDIVSISASYGHSLGLKSDGTVVATGSNGDGECDVSEWSDIVSISAGDQHSLGLKSDGTVVAAGYNKYGECGVSEWSGIIAISAGDGHSLGLKSYGTVVATGDNKSGQCDVTKWKDIKIPQELN